jgi:hypothetical protein
MDWSQNYRYRVDQCVWFKILRDGVKEETMRPTPLSQVVLTSLGHLRDVVDDPYCAGCMTEESGRGYFVFLTG